MHRLQQCGATSGPWRGTGARRTRGRRPMTTRLVEVREGVLKKNDLIARELRARFQQSGVFVVSLVSSPGSGKTALLEATLAAAATSARVAALVGDLATELDANRLRRAGVPVRQIATGTVCHLDAQM